MTLRTLLTLALLAASPLQAETRDPEVEISRAAAFLEAGIAAVEGATGAENRLRALADAVRAYERALAAARAASRDLQTRERAAQAALAEREREVAGLLSALQRVERAPPPLLLLHPNGPAGAARAGHMLAALVPQLDAGAEALREDARTLVALRDGQRRAETLLSEGLTGVRAARVALSAALTQQGRPLPNDTNEILLQLRDDSASLQSFARDLARLPLAARNAGSEGFPAAEGRLALPAPGRVLRPFGSRDAAGILRPGLILQTEAVSLVTTPVAGTLRYAGPFRDYGQIAVIEPSEGWLMIIAGLSTVTRSAGEILQAGEPLGVLGEPTAETPTEDFLIETGAGSGTDVPQTLYVELRQEGVPVDPAPWFDLERGGDSTQ